MRFGILGPLEVSDDRGRPIALGARKQRAVLAILLLHTNEVVASDRVIEELWSGEPPATAAKSLQVHISRLRSALAEGKAGHERIVTAIGGYRLRVEPAELDRDRFEQLVAEGNEAADAQAWELASARLDEALALWRGRPLSDFEYDLFAQAEISRLSELQVAAAERRIEAGLALGHEAQLIGDLERLVREHPYRERLRGQLMLALYRSGRQADALAAYRDARAVLVEELGIEPSAELRELHETILAQDQSLLASGPRADRPVHNATPTAPPISTKRSGAHRALAVGLAAIAAAAAGMLALAMSGGSRLTVSGNSVGVINPGSDRVVGQIAVGAAPAGIAAGAGGVWVANTGDHSTSEIEPTSRRVLRTLALGGTVDGVAAGGGTLWTVDSTRGVAHQIDPIFGTIARTIHLASVLGPLPSSPTASAVEGGSAWFGNSAAAVIRIADGGAVMSTTDVGNHPSGIAVGAGATWVADDIDDTVSRIDPSGDVSATIPVGRGASGIAVGDGSVWVAETLDNALVRINPNTNSVTTTIPVGNRPLGVAWGQGSVWVANSGDGTVSRVDPQSDRVTATIAIGQSPQQLVVTDRLVWVSVQNRPPPVAPAPGGPSGVVRISRERPFQTLDPALTSPIDVDEPQFLYATCAMLLAYPDRAGSAGQQLVPDVAQALPTVSPNGLTYTFHIRSGFRFSPPSGAPVTAATFEHTIERVLSPHVQGNPSSDMGDIVGAQAYEAGKAAHLAGVSARGNELQIRLTRPDRDLPARLAAVGFCAVPNNTPDAPQSQPIPMAGPYYIAASSPEQLILVRNPNYGGSRPRVPREIVYSFGMPFASAVRAVAAGRSDYVSALGLPLDANIPPQLFAALEQRYGSRSAAARSGRQQYFVNSTLSLNSFALNTKRPLFASTRVRRAVDYAIDRQALAQAAGPFFGGQPLNHYLPPAMPGSRPSAIYPLGQPDLARARRLAGDIHATAAMYTCNVAACTQVAQVVQRELSRIGIAVDITPMSVSNLYTRLAEPGQPWDIAWQNWELDYADPSDFLSNLFDPAFGVNFGGFADPTWIRAIRRARTLTGENRLRNYARLDIGLASRAAPIIAWSTEAERDFFAPRIGCETYQPFYGMDLATLCARR
jgi:YVTN family beta-propeller protein